MYRGLSGMIRPGFSALTRTYRAAPRWTTRGAASKVEGAGWGEGIALCRAGEIGTRNPGPLPGRQNAGPTAAGGRDPSARYIAREGKDGPNIDASLAAPGHGNRLDAGRDRRDEGILTSGISGKDASHGPRSANAGRGGGTRPPRFAPAFRRAGHSTAESRCGDGWYEQTEMRRQGRTFVLAHSPTCTLAETLCMTGEPLVFGAKRGHGR